MEYPVWNHISKSYMDYSSGKEGGWGSVGCGEGEEHIMKCGIKGLKENFQSYKNLGYGYTEPTATDKRNVQYDTTVLSDPLVRTTNSVPLIIPLVHLLRLPHTIPRSQRTQNLHQD
jgi:hypothetical protein